MTKVEQLVPGARLRGVVADDLVTVIDAKPRGAAAVDVTYRIESTGRVDGRLLFRSNLEAIEIDERDHGRSYDADATLFRLALEAERIRLAHLFDPQLAVSVSRIEPLPHQVAAVYDVMLRRQPLRFLLADDPGAGKTVMTGLLIKELMLRGDLRRCLIVVPAALDTQWREELEEKFDLHFDLLGREQIDAAVGNPFARHNLVIGRIDLLKQPDNLECLRQVDEDWDLVVVDEAHKLGATFDRSNNVPKETARYKLGKALGDRTRHFLLLTATPHRGKQADFYLLLALLDPDRFAGSFRDGAGSVDVGDMLRRMMKEDLVDFDGRKLFPERFAWSVSYALSAAEQELYEAVTRYVREEMGRADEAAREGSDGRRRRTAIGFALTMLQRRLASSPAAIFHSLSRRRHRLESTLREQGAARGGMQPDRQPIPDLTARLNLGRGADLDELETDLDERPESEADEVVDLATASRTVAELQLEIERLRELEAMARNLCDRGVDAKWRQLRELLTRQTELFEPNGQRRKLIIFTEHKDTLSVLVDQIRALLGQAEAVVAIHGAIPREERREIQHRFNNDPDVVVLVATDAAGEGINLQRRAHLMINYDLPWNPNRLEQRFGRIHRFGQRHDCYCWNLVAAGTREGDVYRTLLDKLDEARRELGGKVFDVVGRLFGDTPLHDLMLKAVKEGDDPARQAQLRQVVADAASLEQYRALIDQYALDKHVLDAIQLAHLKEERERAEINRLVPHFVAAFFVAAFERLGGAVTEREPGRYQIVHVPLDLRRRGRHLGNAPPVLERYARVCFDKARVHDDDKPEAEFVAPGHPLLDLTLAVTLEQSGDVLRRGAVLVDPRPGEDKPRALFVVRGDITDERLQADGSRRPASSELHVVEIDADGAVRGGSVAPYLDYRPPTDDERDLIAPVLAADWLRRLDADAAQDYAIEHLVPRHFDRVQREREAIVFKTEAAVRERLTAEMLYYDERATELRRQEQLGQQPRMNADQARRQFEELRARFDERMRELERERRLVAESPLVIAGALVVPEALIEDLRGNDEQRRQTRQTRRVEALAMREVMTRERAAGYQVTDVSAHNVGYDIEAIHPEHRTLRLIEVKGRDHRGGTVTLTRNEQLVAKNKRQNYVLVIVEIDGETVTDYHAIPDPLGRETDEGIAFGTVSTTFDIDQLVLPPRA